MTLFGLNFEVMNSNNRAAGRNKVDWQAFYYGVFAGLIPWVLIWFAVATGPTPRSGTLPWWVWAILYSYVFMFATFPTNMVLQYTQVLWWDNSRYPDMYNGGYYFGEKIYQILSLTTKSLLVWFVVTGAR